MAIKIGKNVFIQAYPAKKKSQKIYFKNGKAKCCAKDAKVKKAASLSHRLYDLHDHIKNSNDKDEKRQLAGIARRMYKQDHKDYGCIRRILFSLNNVWKKRGFHDETYFLDQINTLSPAGKKRKAKPKEEPKEDPKPVSTDTPKPDRPDTPKAAGTDTPNPHSPDVPKQGKKQAAKVDQLAIRKLVKQFGTNELKSKEDRQNFEEAIAILSPAEIKALANHQKNPFRFNMPSYTKEILENSKGHFKGVHYDESVVEKMEYIFTTLDTTQLKSLIQGYFAKDAKEGSVSDWAFMNILIGINAVASKQDRMELTKALMMATKSGAAYLDLGTHCAGMGKKGKDYKAAIAFIQNYTRIVLNPKIEQETINQRLDHLWNASSAIMMDALGVKSNFRKTLQENQQEKFDAWILHKLDDPSIVRKTFLQAMEG